MTRLEMCSVNLPGCSRCYSSTTSTTTTRPLSRRSGSSYVLSYLALLLADALSDIFPRSLASLYLQVKERLYRFNHVCPLVLSSGPNFTRRRLDLTYPHLRCVTPQELLSQMKPSERKVKLEETYESLTSDYSRILDRAALE